MSNTLHHPMKHGLLFQTFLLEISFLIGSDQPQHVTRSSPRRYYCRIMERLIQSMGKLFIVFIVDHIGQ